MTWYVVFRGRKTRVYDSWDICSEYILDYSVVTYQSYFTRLETDGVDVRGHVV
jgi:viroplasmin and RNaseH domain-containing protein